MSGNAEGPGADAPQKRDGRAYRAGSSQCEAWQHVGNTAGEACKRSSECGKQNVRKRRTKDGGLLVVSSEQPQRSQAPLSEEVKEALRAVLHDAGAAAAAKASASRTLLEYFGAERSGPQRPVTEWTAAELDAEIERVARLTALVKSD